MTNHLCSQLIRLRQIKRTRMIKKKPTVQHGFTMVELAVTMIIMVIPILVIGIILADSHRGWNIMYNRTYADVVTDSYVTRKVFDAIVRKANSGLSEDDWLEVYYYADADSPDIDRYARFYEDGGQLIVERGIIEPREALSTRAICDNVSSCAFELSGRSAQMILTLDNGSQEVTVVASGYMHN